MRFIRGTILKSDLDSFQIQYTTVHNAIPKSAYLLTSIAPDIPSGSFQKNQEIKIVFRKASLQK